MNEYLKACGIRRPFIFALAVLFFTIICVISAYWHRSSYFRNIKDISGIRKHPNIVFILTDDQDKTLQGMVISKYDLHNENILCLIIVCRIIVF